MNIFEYHLKEIHNLILIKKDFLKLDKIENLGKINLEVPPEQFNFDLSCNIAMVLGKSNKLNPKKLAEKLRELFLDQINETHIDKLLNIDINSNLLKKTYNFLIFFMRHHIHSMGNIKGLDQLEKIYNDK